MTDVEKVLMERDEMSQEEAKETYTSLCSDLNDLIADGCSYEDVEDFMYGELGLEMDYLFDMLL